MSETKPKTYDDHVEEALKGVQSGQHLRFVNEIYKTKEVGLAAVKHESTHSSILHDFYSVPMGNLDYVMEHMREIKKSDPYYIETLEDAFLERKETERKPGYYGDFKTYKEMLDSYGAVDYDNIVRKRFA